MRPSSGRAGEQRTWESISWAPDWPSSLLQLTTVTGDQEMLAWLRKWWGQIKAGSAESKTSAEEPIHADLGTGSDAEQAGAPPSDQFLDDQPITGRLSDRFNRAPFASRLAHTLAQRADPSSIVVGLYGPWGDGKTSVLEMMGEALKEYPRVILVRFNPWHFQSQDALLRGFFATLAEAMDE